MSQLSIPTAAQQAEVASLVETILAARAADATADTAEAEVQIDALVAARYGLTPVLPRVASPTASALEKRGWLLSFTFF